MPGQDPYYVHFCRVNFDGTGLVDPDRGRRHARASQYSPDRKYFIDTYSRVDLPPVTELRRSEDGTLVCELEKARRRRAAAAGWQPPERFVAKGRDGTTDIYGVIFRPDELRPRRRSIRSSRTSTPGRRARSCPRRFRPVFGAAGAWPSSASSSCRSTAWAPLTARKAFHDVCWKNLGDAGFPDRILWIKAAAAKYPQMDLSRVGIYGSSAGGQNALGGLLFHGDFYKVGVADCGCHDNRMDKIWWNEQWMGWPVGPHTPSSPTSTNAHKLHGQAAADGRRARHATSTPPDDAGRQCAGQGRQGLRLHGLSGAGHGEVGAYGQRRLRDFFVRNLMGVEPRREM